MLKTEINNHKEQLGSLLINKIKILIVDDSQEICDLLCQDMFISPTFSINTASDINESLKIIKKAPENFHTWIIDLNLKENQSGESLIEMFPQYPYKVVFSGLRSLESASRAIKKGAISAFDKDPVLFFGKDDFFNEICRISSLSFVLDGRPSGYFPIFRLLTDSFITSPDEWAERAFITTRHLQRICEAHGFSPRLALMLYNSLYYLMRSNGYPLNPGDNLIEDIRIQENSEFYNNCLQFTIENIQLFKTKLAR